MQKYDKIAYMSAFHNFNWKRNMYFDKIKLKNMMVNASCKKSGFI